MASIKRCWVYKFFFPHFSAARYRGLSISHSTYIPAYMVVPSCPLSEKKEKGRHLCACDKEEVSPFWCCCPVWMVSQQVRSSVLMSTTVTVKDCQRHISIFLSANAQFQCPEIFKRNQNAPSVSACVTSGIGSSTATGVANNHLVLQQTIQNF